MRVMAARLHIRLMDRKNDGEEMIMQVYIMCVMTGFTYHGTEACIRSFDRRRKT